jgi:hypothetical protein
MQTYCYIRHYGTGQASAESEDLADPAEARHPGKRQCVEDVPEAAQLAIKKLAWIGSRGLSATAAAASLVSLERGHANSQGRLNSPCSDVLNSVL